MGYTHYFRIPKEMDAEKFKQFSDDCKKIAEHCEANGIIVRGPMGNGAPVINETLVSINGDETRNQDHETFHVPQKQNEPAEWNAPDANGNIFNFCKTARKEYDPAVTAMLVALKNYFPQAAISSDGGAEGFDEGVAICEKLFGYGSGFAEDE